VQKLYGSKAAYVDAFNRAVDQLVAEGLILKAGTGGVDDPAK
jgi:Alpha/beta hydrolase domain